MTRETNQRGERERGTQSKIGKKVLKATSPKWPGVIEPAAAVEGVDGRHLGGGEREIKQREVFGQAGGALRFGNHGAPALDAPAERNLRGRAALRGGDRGDDGIVEDVFIGPGHADGFIGRRAKR